MYFYSQKQINFSKNVFTLLESQYPKTIKKTLRKIFGSIFPSKALDATNVPYVSEIRQRERTQILQNGAFAVTLRAPTAIKRLCNFSKYTYLI